MKLSEALKVTGTLGRSGKMPCPTYNTPAQLCITGSKLRKIKGSICHSCYAMKGNFLYPSVNAGLVKNFKAFKHEGFVKAMSFLINRYCKTHFRWFSSGDIENMEALKKIVNICQNTPKIKHWLPTKEGKIVSDYLKIHKNFPKNLTVRVSATMIDGNPSRSFKLTSSVHHKKKAIGHECIAKFQNGKCLDCRKCWDQRIKNISYHKH